VAVSGRGLVAGLLAVAAGTTATGVLAASGQPPPVAHPNPAVFPARLDYENPIRGVDGAPATLAPLALSVIQQALADRDYLAYQLRDDLGGFLPAPVGEFAFSSGGRNVVGAQIGAAQIPHYAAAGDGRVNSFAFVGESPPNTPPDNGTGPVPGGSTPPPSPPPGGNVPPPNGGFGGRPTTTTSETPPTTTPEGGGTTTRPKPPKPPPTTTTATTTPTTTGTTTTTVVTSTTVTTGPAATATTGGGGGASSSCGTAGLTITSDLSSCRIDAVNMAPGDSTFETMTIRNDSGAPFTLTLRASGTQNVLWNDLQMGVWEAGDPAPSPLPSLLSWTTQDNTLATLAAGQQLKLKIELYLPTTAGNGDQNKTAAIDLVWKARG
jgi:hypothetical protein